MKLLKFYSETCGPCKVMGTYLKKLTGIEIQEVDIAEESNEPLLDKYEIGTIPTIVIINDDGSKIADFKGITPIEKILEAIKDGGQTATN